MKIERKIKRRFYYEINLEFDKFKTRSALHNIKFIELRIF